MNRGWRDVIIRDRSDAGQIISPASEDAVAEFIRTRGVTRCPTACVLPTQASVASPDRAALAEYAESRDQVRRARIARQSGLFSFYKS
jgi:hypothetical protein